MLRIETGMHTADISDIASDAACRVLATSSTDKTVRLWSMPEGRLLRVQRLPIEGANGGSVYAVAIAPNGRQIAAGGWDASRTSTRTNSVYLFDTATGTSVRRIGAFGGVINRLAFSPDGTRVAAALGANHGVAVVEVATGHHLMADRDYADGAFGLTFGRGGVLFAVGFDGQLRRYDADLRRTGKVPTPGGSQPRSVSADPSGGRIAVGYNDSKRVDIFDAITLRHLAAADTSGDGNGSLGSVAWSADGRLIGAGGFERRVNGVPRIMMRSWDAEGRRRGADVALGTTNVVRALALCGNDIAYAGAEPTFGLVQATGRVTPIGLSNIPHMRGKVGDSFVVSTDGTTLRFGLEYRGGRPIQFDLNAGTVVDAPTPRGELHAADVKSLKILQWENDLHPKLDNKSIALEQHELSRSAAVRPDRTGILIGTEWALRSFASDGRPRWRQQAPGAVLGVNFAQGGDVVIAAYGDGTVRWHRWSDGHELLAVFVHRRDKRWIAWTPTGYYMASPGAEELIGWHVNRGFEQAADFFPASRFRQRFNRPDIVQLMLDLLDEDAAVKRANETARRREDTKSITARLPPVIGITSPADGARFTAAEATLTYEWRSPSGLAVDRVDVLVDGRPLQARGFDRLGNSPNNEARFGTLALALPPRDVDVALIARAGDLASEPARVRLTWGGGPAPNDDLLKPKLYALVVGVSDYAAPDLRLGYPAKDARDFARALDAQAGGMYGQIQTRLITDRDVTRAEVIRGLKWLEQEVTGRDVGIVFLAGHGVADKSQRYWFMPADATQNDLEVTAVSQDDIKRTLERLAGKALLFIDTCHAGQALIATERRRSAADINIVLNELAAAENGIVAFASSTGRQLSIERDDWQNGAFTKALIEGLLHGRADLLGKGIITVSQLDAFVASRVNELTGGTQHAVMTRPATVPDYPIAVVRR
jgi:WD40 repeat protein